jgi:hypothetical protein
MKKRNDTSLPAIGGSSLLVIFAVLCLVVFSLLSLNTVLAEQRLSAAYGKATEEWYAAELEAQGIYARLRGGEAVPGVEQRENRYVYSVAVSEHQTLQVILENREGIWDVISWQSVAHMEEKDNTLPVWRGLEG